MSSLFRWDVSAWDDGDLWGPVPGQTYHVVEVDSGRDLTFATVLDDYVTSIVAEYGMMESFEEVAPPAELRVTLANPDGLFLPERTDAAFFEQLTPGMLVRWRVLADDGTLVTLWQGRLRSLMVDAGRWQAGRSATLVATDPMEALLNTEYKPALQQQVRVDEALLAMFEANVAPWPYGATPDAAAAYCAFEVGKSVLAWVGDNAEMDSQNIVRAQVFARDVITGEGGGRFFWGARQAQWVFHNREHDINSALAVTLTGDDIIPEESLYSFGDRLMNRVSYDFVPRQVGAPESVIYSYPGLPVFIPKRDAGGTLEFTARYSDPDRAGARIGALDTINPVPYVDYEVMGGGVNLPQPDRTGEVTPTVTFYADRAEVRLVSVENSRTKLLLFQLRGTPLYSYDRMTVTEEDTDSIDLYELHAQPSQILPNIDDEGFARALARWAIVQFAEPFGRFEYVSFEAGQSAALRAQAYTRDVGDRVRLNIAHLNHDREYAIVGVRHLVDALTREHRCQWMLKPLSLLTPFRTDDSLLDGDDRIIL